MMIMLLFIVTFNVFDEDRDGLLSQDEITNMITALIRLKLENIPDSSKVRRKYHL